MKNLICRLHGFSVILLLIFLLASCASSSVIKPEKSYKVGDVGPAGGMVFFDKGELLDGYRYLEVAPQSTEVTLQWGSFDSTVGDTSFALGEGRNNTSLIVASQGNKEQRNHAAAYCNDLSIGGYEDWFLPSKEELDILFWQLANSDIGEFKKLGFGYWSSSEVDETQAWGQGFTAGVQGKIEKRDLFLVRAIRTF